MTVHLFARLRDLAGRQSFTCDVPAGATVADAWHAVVSCHASLEPFGRSISCAVNDDFARMTVTLDDGDEVAFLPPVSGGSGSCP
ncbi:MAG TPA: MoaD/ThiS family protein [Vicinamibacterales bacterium]|nr:MoaD/ThiS family protein [Vicinamibacterales bacterium]